MEYILTWISFPAAVKWNVIYRGKIKDIFLFSLAGNTAGVFVQRWHVSVRQPSWLIASGPVRPCLIRFFKTSLSQTLLLRGVVSSSTVGGNKTMNDSSEVEEVLPRYHHEGKRVSAHCNGCKVMTPSVWLWSIVYHPAQQKKKNLLGKWSKPPGTISICFHVSFYRLMNEYGVLSCAAGSH